MWESLLILLVPRAPPLPLPSQTLHSKAQNARQSGGHFVCGKLRGPRSKATPSTAQMALSVVIAALLHESRHWGHSYLPRIRAWPHCRGLFERVSKPESCWLNAWCRLCFLLRPARQCYAILAKTPGGLLAAEEPCSWACKRPPGYPEALQCVRTEV